MGILDTIKGAFRTDVEEDRPVGEETPEEGVPEEPTTDEVVFGGQGAAMGVLREPHVTEKATRLSEEGSYVFRVQPGATKSDIRRAVERVYGVRVRSVRTIRMPAKLRRRGQHTGVKSGYKKAIVSLEQGERIEILPH